LEGGYDAFNSESIFYNDVCTPFTNENGNDVLLDERRSDYFNENLQLCGKDCTFIEYNPSTHLYSCNCKIQGTKGNSNNIDTNIVTKQLPEEFYKKHKFSNIEVFKCASQVFSSEGQKKNFGSYVLMACFVSWVGALVFYIFKGKVNTLFNEINKNQIDNQIKEDAKPDDVDSKNEQCKKEYEGKQDFTESEENLNYASFEEAERDKRGFLRIYWSLLKNKQLLIFTFYTSTDHNLRVVKVALFILFMAFYFAFTALFFSDSIMKSIYIYKGNTDAAVHVPNIILSSLCCLIANFLVKFFSLSDRDYSKIQSENEPVKRKELIQKTQNLLKIKLMVMFAISGALITLCWYYVSAFCAVFKNSQGHYFTNVLIAFIVCNLWPCFTTLFAPLLRLKGIKNKSACMYKASKIISYI
jgi:hypothetical protein